MTFQNNNFTLKSHHYQTFCLIDIAEFKVFEKVLVQNVTFGMSPAITDAIRL